VKFTWSEQVYSTIVWSCFAIVMLSCAVNQGWSTIYHRLC